MALNDATLWDLMGRSVPKPRIRLELQIDLFTFHVSSKSVYNPLCAKCEAAPSQLRMSGRMSSSQRLHSWHVSEACISVDKATERPLAHGAIYFIGFDIARLSKTSCLQHSF